MYDGLALVWVTRTLDEIVADFRDAVRLRRRAVSLTASGDASDPRFTVVWTESTTPSLVQRFEPGIESGRAEILVHRWEAEGFEPALVAMTGTERQTLAFVLERRVDGAPPRTFMAPRPFRDAAGDLFTVGITSATTSCLWVAAAGEPRGPSGEGVVVAAIFSGGDPERVAWAVHFDAVGEKSWSQADETRLLASISTPTVAIELERRDGARFVLSLFRDERFVPWPSPNPFAFGADSGVCEGDASDAVRVRSVSVCAGRQLTVVTPADRSTPLPRRFVTVDEGDAAPPFVTPDVATRATAHPIDEWMLGRMRESGARHAQIAVVRGRKLSFARAYTFAEDGYPVATMRHALRLGSVSKALTSIALARCIAASGAPPGLDTPITDPQLLDLPAGPGSMAMSRVTLRALLMHRAGFPSFPRMDPDEPKNPLSESRVRSLVGRSGPALPGALREALARAPGEAIILGPNGVTRYSNEGFALLGEIVSRLVTGTFGELEAVFGALFEASGADVGTRGTMAAPTTHAAWRRAESPAHGSSPSWAESLFESAKDLRPSIVPLPYAANLRFYGGAAGLSVPVLWVARVLCELALPRPSDPGEEAPRFADALRLLLEPARAGADATYGLYVSEPGWWTGRPTRAGLPVTFRTLRLHHNGRVEGGASLLVHQVPLEPHPDHVPLGVVVAMNQLGPLYEDPHGRELFAILRSLEAGGAWTTQDRFPVGMAIAQKTGY